VTEASFLFVSCQNGAEAALKDELAREHPELKFAFSRPGFVTFKSPKALEENIALRSVFARAYGISRGQSRAHSIPERVKETIDLASSLGKGFVLHTWERDWAAPGEEAPEHPYGESLEEVSQALRAAAHPMGGLFLERLSPEPGDRVFDVILIDPEHWWLGVHLHSGTHSADPGGKPRIPLPTNAPSRAYLKLEEGIRWAGLKLEPGDRALEIGSAPGGASFALLERGLEVVGVDPAAMDPKVAAHPRFRHAKKGVSELKPADLGGPIQWILLDMNVPPQIALEALERLWPWAGRETLGLLLTLKLNRWRIAAEIPAFLKRISSLGLARAEATQLPSNRQEFFVCGLTRKGLSRTIST
jgi:23S rRNA (cytidine2498-2'-O)-methyltransferase